MKKKTPKSNALVDEDGEVMTEEEILERAERYMNATWGFYYSGDDYLDNALYAAGETELLCWYLVDSACACEDTGEIGAKAVIHVADRVVAEHKHPWNAILEVIDGFHLVECSNCNHVGHYEDKDEAKDHAKNGSCCSCATKGHMKLLRKTKKKVA